MTSTVAGSGEPIQAAADGDPTWASWVGYDRMAVGVLVVALAIVVAAFRDYGVTWDEPGLRAYGRMLVDWYASGFTDGRAFEFANLRYYGGGFDIVATLLEPLVPLDAYATRHLLGGLVGILGLALVWRLARRLGGRRAGLLALLMLATLPGWWGHMFFNSKDIPFAVGMLASLLMWIRCVEEWPRPRLHHALLLGLSLGLTLGIRVGGVLFGFYVALSLLALTVVDERRVGWAGAGRQMAGGIVRLLPAVPVTILVLLPAWPWVALAPGNFLDAIGYLSRFPYTADTIFAGQRFPALAVPLSYWPTLLALQLPEIVLAGLALSAALVPTRASLAADRHRLAILIVAVAGLFPFLYAMLERPTAYNALRHFTFALPPLVVLAALGLDRALSRLPARWLLPGMAAIAAGLLLPAIRIAQLHPYEYIYFNDLSGGVRAADGRYELDYWGTSFGELGRLLDAQVLHHHLDLGLQPIPARICGPFETSQEILPASLLPVRHNSPARLAIAVAIFFCVEPPPGSELARVERQGVVLSRAYRVGPDAVITSFTAP